LCAGEEIQFMNMLASQPNEYIDFAAVVANARAAV
jgi:hypothetical protein